MRNIEPIREVQMHVQFNGGIADLRPTARSDDQAGQLPAGVIIGDASRSFVKPSDIPNPMTHRRPRDGAIVPEPVRLDFRSYRSSRPPLSMVPYPVRFDFVS